MILKSLASKWVIIYCFLSCLSIVYWNITIDYILIIYCLKQLVYQSLVARSSVNYNTERKPHREPKSLTRFLIGALNGVIKLLSGWKIKFLTNNTTEKHEINRKFVCLGERSKIISLVNTWHYIFLENISSGVHEWNNFSIFHPNKQVYSLFSTVIHPNKETQYWTNDFHA